MTNSPVSLAETRSWNYWFADEPLLILNHLHKL
jgi:hypothetical protein